MTADPFGRALRDEFLGTRAQPLIQRDGADSLEHPIQSFYFDSRSVNDDTGRWLENWLQGPSLDMGAGIGRDALYFQQQFETVAIETSDALVETMRERGVDDARNVDMFELRSAFDADRYRSALSYGTQLGLARSMSGLRQFLNDLADVTQPDATAVLDGYDPTEVGVKELLGYRADPTPGLAYRVMHFEYGEIVGPTLLFRLFSVDRLQEAVADTRWDVAAVRRGSGTRSYYYLAALTKP